MKKRFQCPIDKCHKLYGTYAALYLHFKNKHPDRSMKLIAHSLNNIKVTKDEEEDEFEKQLKEFRELKDEETRKKVKIEELSECRK